MTYLPAIEIQPTHTATASIIWLHGLGASGNDFAGLVPELNKMLGHPDGNHNNIRYIFPHAAEIPVTINGGFSMPAWYDILSIPTSATSSGERSLNQDQFLSSVRDIQNLIDRELERGIKSENILVLGFSQGGSVAYYSALTYPHTLAGVAGLSTYFPLMTPPDTFTPSENNQGIDIQIFHGEHDPVVNESLGIKAKDDLSTLGYSPQYHHYPMEHQVCFEEVRDIAIWIKEKLN